MLSPLLNMLFLILEIFSKDLKVKVLPVSSPYNLWFIHIVSWLWLLDMSFLFVLSSQMEESQLWEVGGGVLEKKSNCMSERNCVKAFWLWEDGFLFIIVTKWLEQVWLKIGPKNGLYIYSY